VRVFDPSGLSSRRRPRRVIPAKAAIQGITLSDNSRHPGHITVIPAKAGIQAVTPAPLSA